MSDKVIPQRLYINTFTMSSDQSVDYDCEIDLGVDVKVNNSLRLDSAIIENKMASFYQSIKYDYRDLDFSFSYRQTNALSPLVTINIPGLKGDQALNFNNFASYIQEYIRIYLGREDISIVFDDYFGHLKMFIRILIDGVLVIPYQLSVNFISEGWLKIGAELGVSNAQNDQGFIIFPHCYDFAPPSTVLVQFIGIPIQGSIQNKYGGSILASIPCDIGFGQRIVWNRQSDSDNICYVTQPVWIRKFRIRILSCDQMPLQSVRTIRNNTDLKLGATGENDVECIFIISCQ